MTKRAAHSGSALSAGTLGCLLWSLAIALRAAAAAAPVDGTVFFESRIRPVLAEKCFSCHGEEKQKGHLRLDSPAAIAAGGENGPVLVPGHPESSRLIEAVTSTNADLQMPPKKKLGERAIADLVEWVRVGAPWPANSATQVVHAIKSAGEITDKDRAWWAFQPIRRPPVPRTRSGVTVLNPIDAFIAAPLAARGLTPNPPASRRELIRRAYFDLIGLPPTPEEIDAFERDPRPDAWEQRIDHLLSLPQYGERWGRHWLDVVRFAQSNGYERDGEKPYAWRYRDYVIRAFNEDKPYDEFVREQIAGDELPEAGLDGLIATGFQRLGVWDDEPDDKRMAEFDELDDILSTTGTAFLGLTLGCARCHEHKFDPIPQADYYHFLAFFRNVTLYENARYTIDSPNYLPLASREAVEKWKSEHAARLEPLRKELAATTNAETKKKLTKQLDGLQAESPPFEWTLGVRERGARPPVTQVLLRGNAANPGPEVEPGFLSVIGETPPAFPQPSPHGDSSGRRIALANWIASPDNPLTARVMANRIWQHHFGRGLVKTTSDFGHAGSLPTHPELLNWLAAELIAQRWSIKALHRVILQSGTYRMSSRADHAEALAVDPANDLFWRQNLRRLEAESIRDSVLAISGQLNCRMGGRGFFPRLSGEVLAGQSRPGLDWEISPASELARRSLYAYVRRTMAVPVLEAFDYSNTATPLSERPVTTVAPQALMLLNDAFMEGQASAFAARLTREAGPDVGRQIERGFQLAVGRRPTANEDNVARTFLAEQESAFARIPNRVTFRPEVPASLSVDYMTKLKPENYISGPSSGWSYHRGVWSGAYEGIRTVDRTRGPFVLSTEEPFADGSVTATIILHPASESAGLLLRATAENEELRGYEFWFDPRGQQVALRRHDKSAGATVLAQAAFPLTPGTPFTLRADVSGARFRLWLKDGREPVLDVTDPNPLSNPGRVGLKTWGAALSLDSLVLNLRERTIEPPAAIPLPSARARALSAFCLLLLNLNEVIYVD